MACESSHSDSVHHSESHTETLRLSLMRRKLQVQQPHRRHSGFLCPSHRTSIACSRPPHAGLRLFTKVLHNSLQSLTLLHHTGQQPISQSCRHITRDQVAALKMTEIELRSLFPMSMWTFLAANLETKHSRTCPGGRQTVNDGPHEEVPRDDSQPARSRMFWITAGRKTASWAGSRRSSRCHRCVPFNS